MYPNLQEKAVVDAAEKIMIETMKRYDPSHDRHHVERVRKTALSLARNINPTPDLLIVEIAALLHDVLDKKYVSPEEAADPYNFFLPFFQEMSEQHGLDLIQDGRAKIITRVIENVSWTTENKLRAAGEWSTWHDQCVELHCVQDADRLDAIGAFGIMRCAAYGTVINRPLHTAPGDPEYEHATIHHFYDKLVKIRDRLKTVPGKKLGVKRHQVLLDFLASVDEEAGGKIE
ncbi:Putative protein YpgQ [Psilocybe cubensis]|uniref:HD/PDEase domain-containing protein n=2 Tax=Psilocybe cubensis TaxID=181762 RepID=A0A8H7Y2G9_PSICU|nr:Putative protein YpgQ [Psilocybe cubensis]KAH9481241.1 Putative protein YpgQ [Psilocybe cubensis]